MKTELDQLSKEATISVAREHVESRGGGHEADASSSSTEHARNPERVSRVSLFRRATRLFQRQWRRARSRLDAWLIRWGARSRLANWFYYCVWTGRLRREQRAILAGRIKFQIEADDPPETSAQLRRGVHRLEKGLLMRPRRDIFALDYIRETFGTYRELLNHAGTCERAIGELTWAHDVLEAYFDATANHPKIDPLREEFRQLPEPGACSTARFVPYKRDLTAPDPVRWEALRELTQRRRSVRWFLQERVPRELIEQAVEIAAQSPSACNRQPFVFRVFDEPELAHQVGGIPAGTTGFSHQFPAVIVVVGRLRAYFDERDRHVIYIDGALASMSLVYALETLGLSSCCINWPDIEEREREMERVLQLEPDERPIMLIAVGYPDPEGLVAYSQKKSVDQLCRFNFE